MPERAALNAVTSPGLKHGALVAYSCQTVNECLLKMQVLARRLRLEGTFDFVAVAAKTPGYVGADLAALTKEAGANAITRVFTSLRPSRNVGHSSTICRPYKV